MMVLLWSDKTPKTVETCKYISQCTGNPDTTWRVEELSFSFLQLNIRSKFSCFIPLLSLTVHWRPISAHACAWCREEAEEAVTAPLLCFRNRAVLSQCNAASKVRDASHKMSLKGGSAQGMGDAQTTNQRCSLGSATATAWPLYSSYVHHPLLQLSAYLRFYELQQILSLGYMWSSVCQNNLYAIC